MTNLRNLLHCFAMGMGIKAISNTLYLREHPDGYLYSSFKRAIRRYRYHTKTIGHVEHLVGDQMYIDYAGDKVKIIDAVTCETRQVEVFVAILPCSHYTYWEAVWSQKKEFLVSAYENALRFLGGAPLAVVPDNLKSVVTKCDRNEPVINDNFEVWPNSTAWRSFWQECAGPRTRPLWRMQEAHVPD